MSVVQLVSSSYKINCHVNKRFITLSLFYKNNFNMKTPTFSLILIVLIGFVYVESSNPLTNLFGKGHDEKVEDEKNAATTTTTVKPAEEIITANSKSSCGGLKGFLHICDKTETTEPPKNIKTRSVSKEDSDSDSDSDDSDSDESKEESDNAKEKEEEVKNKKEDEVETENKEENEDEVEKEDEEEKEEGNDEKSSTEGTIKKREAEKVEKSEHPPNPMEFYAPELLLEKRQINEYSSESDSSESEEYRKVKRDCRDGDGRYVKDCRKKRELVPLLPNIIKKDKTTTTEPNTTK